MAHGLRHTLGQLGWRDAALYWCARALTQLSGGRWHLHRYHFIAQYVGATPLNVARGRDIDIAPHDPQVPLPAAYPRPAVVVAARLAQGARSLVAWRGQRLAGFLWLIDGAYQEDEVRARFQLASPQAAWDFDVWVAPDQRLGMTFVRLWEAARLQLRARGVRWTCSRISAFNPASLRAHAAIGVVPLGSALFVCCGQWQWMFASMAPRFHWSRVPSSYPVLTFDTRALSAPIKEPS
jgi:hypothetical protein